MEAVIESLAGGKVNSLSRLTRDVLSHINEGKSRYAVSPRRVKKVAARDRVVRIRMLTRRSTRSMEKCPLCGEGLRELEATDLYGRETRWGKACKACGFEIDPGRREPARYLFDLRW